MDNGTIGLWGSLLMPIVPLGTIQKGSPESLSFFMIWSLFICFGRSWYMLCHAVEVRGQISPVTSLLLSCESRGPTQVGSDRCIYPLSRPMGPLLFFILTTSKRGSTGALFSFYRWEGFLCGNAFWVPQYGLEQSWYLLLPVPGPRLSLLTLLPLS